ncbi:MAG: hypothetical protein KDI55_07665, partial [Anaerolineae bacterium]|nr:hypothetical protein [Anaerolineae bacterium]
MMHFALNYAKHVNEILHNVLWSTWFYKHEIIEVPGLVTALLVTYDNQKDDEFDVASEQTWSKFLQRMSRVKHDWSHFSQETMERLADFPQKKMLGWEGRTIYFIRGGSNPGYWSAENASADVTMLISTSVQMHGPMIQNQVQELEKSIRVGQEQCHEYEDFIRVIVNFLFIDHLGEATLQARTKPENEGTEIRDVICQNRAEAGFWKDLKDKYSCSEIVFEAKNTNELTRDNLRQIYCYLKPALGFWGFIVCRTEQHSKIHAYNRTLFKNFSQQRGVLILSDLDFRKMVE